MLELKFISKEAVPEAISKAERYRLLNEPAEAESICQDVLRIDPENQQALITLLLALTDQFEDGLPVTEATEVVQRLQGDYERAYYSGIIAERQAKAYVKHGHYGSGSIAYEYLSQAMRCYEQAEALRRSGNDDALLRWNACARFRMRQPHLQPEPLASAEPILSE